MTVNSRRNIFTLLFLQAILLVLFGVFARYSSESKQENSNVYPMFQDVNAMIFLGFGMLMTFLKKYGYSAIGFNFFLAALLAQWAMLCYGFFHLENYKILLSVESLMKADVAVASVLISMGAVLGRTSLLQLSVMGVIELILYTANSYVGLEIFQVSDAGASIFVHTFGAYFGLAVSFVLNKLKHKSEASDVADSSLEESSYISDIFSAIGTIVLWLFWPSFNAGELTGDDQQRAVINTYLSLTASCVAAFVCSSLVTHDSKFDMVHVQNATLAGGVAVGAVANLMIQPYGAIVIGLIAGTLSVIGYRFLTPWIDRTIHIHDTCGVHNLHGMPGVISAIAVAIMAAIASEQQYQSSLYDIFPARAPQTPYYDVDAGKEFVGEGRTSLQQAGYQILALVVTLLVAIVTGSITGIIISRPLESRVLPSAEYNDVLFWKLPESDTPQEAVNKDSCLEKLSTAELIQKGESDVTNF